jgi:hypothetical protein
MSGTKSGTFELILGTVAGAIAGRVAYTTIAGLPAYALQIIEIVGGGAVAWFMPNEPLIRGIGIGLLAEGTVQTATLAIPAMNGIDLSTQYNPTKHISGYRDVPKVGDFPKPAAVGRYDAMMARAYKGVY